MRRKNMAYNGEEGNTTLMHNASLTNKVLILLSPP